jgi:hypothetical protein
MVEAPVTITPMESTPVNAVTWSVSRPPRLSGSFTDIAWFCHDVTVSDCAVPPPAGVAITWHPPHCAPRFAPLSVMVVPAVTVRPGAVVDRGVTEKMAAPNLQRVAAK